MSPAQRRQFVVLGIILAAAGAALVLAAALVTYSDTCLPGQPSAIEVQGERVLGFCGGSDGPHFLVGGLLSVFGGLGLLAWFRRVPLR